MPTLTPVDPTSAPEPIKTLLASFQQRTNGVPNMLRLLAHSSAILDLYQRFNAAMQQGKMTARLRTSIAVFVAEVDGCDYHLSTTYAYARQMADGPSAAELDAARRGESADPRIAAALRFVRRVVEQRGAVGPGATGALRESGYTDEEIVEMIAMIALATFRDYFNLIAETEIDVPVVHAYERSPH